MKDFGKLYEGIKHFVEGPFYERTKKQENKKIYLEIEKLADSILCGKYKVDKGKHLLVSPGGRKVDIANSSSGQQEILPLILFLSLMPIVKFGHKGTSVYIEEPEAHLFPSSQKNIVELMSYVFNSTQESQFLITTHSPYILTTVNNLMQAGELLNTMKKEKHGEIFKILPEYSILNPRDVTTYSIVGRKCNKILSKETGLIDTNIIDEVSNEMSATFDSLIDL